MTRHLAFAFNEFLERQKNKDGVDDNKQTVITQAKELISSAFDLPEDDNDESLKVRITSQLSLTPHPPQLNNLSVLTKRQGCSIQQLYSFRFLDTLS